jgi:hypothetical protein
MRRRKIADYAMGMRMQSLHAVDEYYKLPPSRRRRRRRCPGSPPDVPFRQKDIRALLVMRNHFFRLDLPRQMGSEPDFQPAQESCITQSSNEDPDSLAGPDEGRRKETASWCRSEECCRATVEIIGWLAVVCWAQFSRCAQQFEVVLRAPPLLPSMSEQGSHESRKSPTPCGHSSVQPPASTTLTVSTHNDNRNSMPWIPSLVQV